MLELRCFKIPFKVNQCFGCQLSYESLVLLIFCEHDCGFSILGKMHEMFFYLSSGSPIGKKNICPSLNQIRSKRLRTTVTVKSVRGR